jgi:hypothetical protein
MEKTMNNRPAMPASFPSSVFRGFLAEPERRNVRATQSREKVIKASFEFFSGNVLFLERAGKFEIHTEWLQLCEPVDPAEKSVR